MADGTHAGSTGRADPPDRRSSDRRSSDRHPSDRRPTGGHSPDGRSVANPPPDSRAALLADLTAAMARIDGRGEQGGPSPRPAEEGPTVRAPGDGAAARRPDEDSSARPADEGPVVAAKRLCLTMLTGRARSRAELADGLRRRGVPEDAAVEALDRLETVGLIDDVAYAHDFVASKHRHRGWGPGALRAGLRKKGIAPEISEQAIASIDPEAERERAADVVAKKLDSAVFGGLPHARRRLLGLLARRGYSSSVSISVVNEALRGYVDPLDEPD